MPDWKKYLDKCPCSVCQLTVGHLEQYTNNQMSAGQLKDLDAIASRNFTKTFAECTEDEQFNIVYKISTAIIVALQKDPMIKDLPEDATVVISVGHENNDNGDNNTIH